MYIPRDIAHELDELLGFFPAVGILGPRQVGKTSLLRSVIASRAPDSVVYLDLERPEDLRRLEEPNAFFDANASKLVVIDEVQRAGALFPILRGAIDRTRRPGRFALLGSTSPTLLRTSGESLAGRIAYVQLHGLTPRELTGVAGLGTRWVRGGFPDSLLAPTDALSLRWRDSFLRAYVERDLQLLGLTASPATVRNFWSMLAHLNGQLLNVEALTRSIGLDRRTVERYLDLFEEAFLIRRLRPYHANLGKRLVKSPRLYIRDSGLLHALLEVRDANDLAGRTQRGASFEGLCVELAASYLDEGRPMYFYRAVTGAAVDLVIERGGRPHTAIEIKASTAPSVSRGFYTACDDLRVERRYLLGIIDEPYPTKGGVEVIGLRDLPRVLGR